MLPCRLILQAFGAYPNRVEIPFYKLGSSNIYLISGVTGSGKTTIFDAICFALFNSSSTSTRGNASFRSHYAKSDTISYVEFEFLFNGERYIIKRSPSFLRKKIRGEGEILENSKAQIQLPNSKLIVGTKEVDEFVVELLGLNINQFSQIALLAQGEFLKLLNSDTQTRGEIFRTIFKTESFLNFQNNLKDCALQYKQEFEQSKRTILQYLSLIDLEDETKDYCIDNSVLVDFENFIEKIENKNKFDKKRIQELDKLLNEKQNELSNAKNKLNLIEQSEKIKNEIDLKKDSFLKAKQEFDSINKKEELLNNTKLELEKIKEDYIAASEIKELEIEALDKKEELLLLKKETDELDKLIKFEKLSHISFEYSNCQSLSDEYNLKENELIGKKEVLKTKSFEYENFYQAYLSNIAGFLALELKESSPCPVCGATNHPKKASVKEENITKEFVEKKKEELEGFRESLNLCAQNLSVLKEKKEGKLKEYNALKELYKLENENVTFSKRDFAKNINSFLEKKEKNNSEIENKNSSILILEAKIDTLKKNLKNPDIENISKNHKELCLKIDELSFEIEKIKNDYEKESTLFLKLNSQHELLLKQIDSNISKEVVDNLALECDKLSLELRKISSTFDSNKKLILEIKENYSNYLTLEQKYIDYKALSDCANGNLKGKSRLAFEQYIQGYYLDRVLYYANKTLLVMTKGQFKLLRKKEAVLLGKTGLDLEVMDFHTFKKRDTKTLSGGESFKAALALALGLSQCVSELSGAINIDAMFIDEGFGSLDRESLDLALEVILNMCESNRLIGIISHVEELKTKIQNQIITIKTPEGSKVELTF